MQWGSVRSPFANRQRVIPPPKPVQRGRDTLNGSVSLLFQKQHHRIAKIRIHADTCLYRDKRGHHDDAIVAAPTLDDVADVRHRQRRVDHYCVRRTRVFVMNVSDMSQPTRFSCSNRTPRSFRLKMKGVNDRYALL